MKYIASQAPAVMALDHRCAHGLELGAAPGTPFWASAVSVCANHCQRESVESWASQLANVEANLDALRRGMHDLHQQVQHIAAQPLAGARALPQAAVEVQHQSLQELRQELRGVVADGLRDAELQTSMAVNRALAEQATEIANREAALRAQLRSEFSEQFATLRSHVGSLDARALRLEAMSPDLQSATETSHRELHGLNSKLQDVGCRMSQLELKGVRIAQWVEQEGKSARAALDGVETSLGVVQHQQARFSDGLQECRETLIAQIEDATKRSRSELADVLEDATGRSKCESVSGISSSSMGCPSCPGKAASGGDVADVASARHEAGSGEPSRPNSAPATLPGFGKQRPNSAERNHFLDSLIQDATAKDVDAEDEEENLLFVLPAMVRTC